MKILKATLFATLGMMALQCTAQKKSPTSTSKNLTKVIQTTIQKVELEEMTRGTNKNLVYTPASKTVKINDAPKKSSFSSTEWSDIARAAEVIDLSKLATYEAPTTARFYDGALAATIKIHKNGKMYTSQSFDSGKPPKELAALYKLLSPAFSK